MVIEKEVLEQLLAGRDPATVFSQDGLIDELKKALSERVLNAELDRHLDTDAGNGEANRRNGRSQKTVLTGTSKVTLDIPRDRSGTFDPQLIAKYQRRFPDFDEKIISMYARGMTVREIRGHLEEIYGLDVSPDLISTVTDAVLEEVGEWQNRALDACYAIVFFDAIRVKIRDEGFVRNKAVYIALAVLPDGTREILGLWIEQTEGAKFWLRVMNELKNRGLQDILVAVVDGLKGFPEAINATFPETVVQTCIVHLLRHSMNFVMEGSQTCRAGAEGGLPGRRRRGRPGGPGRIRSRTLGREISRHRPKLAAQLGSRHSLLRLPRGGPSHDLHDQCHRVAQRQDPACRSNARPLPQ